MLETHASTAGSERFDQHLVAGGELLRRDDVAGARAELAAAVQLRPDDLKALGLFGLACFREGAFEAALPIYRKLVDLRPNDASHRLNLGLVYLKVGQADLAIQELGRSRELDPSQQRTVSYLGLAYARRGDYAAAYEAFMRAGQEQLALEMEQYLPADERQAIRVRVVGDGGRAGVRPADLGLDSDVYETVERGPVAGFDAEMDEDEAEDAIEEMEEGVITRAVAMAVPAIAAATTGTRVGVGQEAPQPLTELATRRLIRPEDGDHPFEIGAGGVLIARVGDGGRILSRLADVVVACGELRFDPVARRVRGASTSELLGGDERAISFVSGHGYMVIATAAQCFTVVALDDDILYLREDLVHAFEEALRWESGHVPGSSGAMRSVMQVVQFRGRGCVALRSRRPLLSLKLASDRAVRVEVSVLAGWIGRVVPRVLGGPLGGASRSAFVECSGEGVVLLEDQGGA